MPSIKDSERLKQVSKCLPATIYKNLLPFINQLSSTAVELRLRLNRPFSVVCSNSIYYISADGNLTGSVSDKYMLVVTKSDIDSTFQKICNYSVYNSQSEIVNGFVTMTGGHRAGISGTAVMSNGTISNVRDITSINIRIAREHKGCSKELLGKIKSFDRGVLICGPPCSGKTTILRDLARTLSTTYCKNIALIDERGELAGTTNGVFQNDIGMCDVYDCYSKSEGLMQAIRSMSPDIVMCDEIGSAEDVCAVSQAVNCGVSVVATVHCTDKDELRSKRNIFELAKINAFSTIVFLENKSGIGSVKGIMKAGEVFDF